MERKGRPTREEYGKRLAGRGCFLGRARGQSILEFALLLPMLLLLLVGAIDIGRYAYNAIMVSNAAHAGAAYGAQNRFTAADLSGITVAVCQDFAAQATCNLTVTKGYVCQCDSNGTIGSAINCTTGTCPTTDVPGEIESLWVTVKGTFSPLFNFPGFTQSITLKKTATLRIEAE